MKKTDQYLQKALENKYNHYMGFKDLDMTKYQGDAYEQMGRYVIDALGAKQLVILPKFDWDYIDWLYSIGADMDQFIKDCDMQRGNHDLGTALRSWIYHLYQHREEEGLPRPPWITA